jgi:DNA invertase Pin-like site-specific DNA recombinase
MKAAIYTRVSTTCQTTEQQVSACRRYCEARGWEVVAVIEEIQSTRRTRPEKEKLLTTLRRREYDALVLFRLDRWARNLSEMVLEIEDLTSRGIQVVSLNETVDTTSAMGRAMLQLVGVFAQLERDLRVEATRERLASLKAIGKRLGHRSTLRGERYTRLVELKARGLSNRHVAEELGVSEAAVRRALKDGPRRCPIPVNPPATSTEPKGSTLS